MAQNDTTPLMSSALPLPTPAEDLALITQYVIETLIFREFTSLIYLTSPSHALGVAVIISIQSVLLEWNCLKIILSAAHLAFGKCAKRVLALF